MRREEVQRRTRRKKIFSDEEISRAAGERWRAAEATVAYFPQASPSCPGFLRPRFAGGLRKPGSVLLSEKDFLPIARWAAKWCGDVEG